MSPVITWLLKPAMVIVEVVMSSAVPVPPPPGWPGIGRGTWVDATGPMTGWATSVITYDAIGDTIGLPFSSSGVTM